MDECKARPADDAEVSNERQLDGVAADPHRSPHLTKTAAAATAAARIGGTGRGEGGRGWLGRTAGGASVCGLLRRATKIADNRSAGAAVVSAESVRPPVSGVPVRGWFAAPFLQINSAPHCGARERWGLVLLG